MQQNKEGSLDGKKIMPVKISIPFWILKILLNSNLGIYIVPKNIRKKVFVNYVNPSECCLFTTIHALKNILLKKDFAPLCYILTIKTAKILEFINKEAKEKYEKKKICIYEHLIFKNLGISKIKLSKWKKSFSTESSFAANDF